MRKLNVVLLVVIAGCGRQAVTNANMCSTGTMLVADKCVATETCGAGTHDVSGACVADLRCGQGTTLNGIECEAVGSVTCGSGTTLSGTTCVATSLSCGTGTTQVGTQCLPSGTAVTCGTGTTLTNGVCVATSNVTCGTGTMLAGNECVPSGTAVTCGPNTTLQNGQCVAPSPITCGTGTTLSGSTCVVIGGSDHYEVRVPVTHVPADGYSKIPAFSIGTLASGAVSTAQVILTVNPSYAGSVSPNAFTLDELGNTSYFTPCNSNSPACSGTFEIDLALATAPGTVIASSGTLTLDVPTGVYSAANCMGGTSVIFFDGDSSDYIHPGTDTITQGTWTNQSSANGVTISVTPSNSQQGLWWDLEFSTSMLGQPLQQNVYTMAERAPFASPGHPGIDIGGDGRGCNTITGSFQIENITWNNGTLTDFLASFEQHCEGGTPALRGCVHYH